MDESEVVKDPDVKVRRRRKMLQQMKSNNREEDELHTAMKQHEKNLLDDAFRRTVSGFVVLLFIGVIGIVYARPKFLFPDHKDRLPSRTITTVYPRDLKIAKSLPTVVLGYAIASPQNQRERAAVRQVATQRKMVTYAARGTRQVIQFNPIEHDDFVRKLITSQPGALDYFCGSGYQDMYQGRVALVQHRNDAALDDMLLACLIHSGTADGYVKHTVQVHSSLSRGIQGVAVQYRNQKRILSDLMWMPILEHVGKRKRQQDTAPATMMPLEMTKYLLATVEPSMSEWIYRQEWEEFLYKVIAAEPSKWTLFTAVCTEDERDELSSTARLIATSCRTTDDCCWVFDTALKPASR